TLFHSSPFAFCFTLPGKPAMMLPLGKSPGGLPVAVQCVARFGDEATLLRLGAQLEAARPWIGRQPAVTGGAGAGEPGGAGPPDRAQAAGRNLRPPASRTT